MRALQLCHRSACAASLSLRRAPFHPSITSSIESSVYVSHPQASSVEFVNAAGNANTSSNRLSKAVVAATATGVVISTALTEVAHSDATATNTETKQKQENVNALSSLSLQSPSLLDLSTQRTKPKSSNELLFEKVAKADANAVQTLSSMISDTSIHELLLNEDVIKALVEGLTVCREKDNESLRPIQLAILRILADLAEHNATHSKFSNDNLLPETLCPILSDIVNQTTEPWTNYLQRQVSFISSKSTPLESISKQKEKQLSDNEFMLLDINTKSSSSQKDVSIDLNAGITYNALRCIANLSRHTHLHTNILSTSLLSHVCNLLKNLYIYYPNIFDANSSNSPISHHYIDLLKYSTLTVSALAKSAPLQIVNNHAHIPIIQLTSQSFDTSIQMYAAGGIRNLARHRTGQLSEKDKWKVHREIVVAGVDKALIECMKSSSSNIHSKSFAISSFTDLMTSGHHKAHLIRKRLSTVYPHYADALKDRNTLIFRSIGRSLSILFNDENSSKLSDNLVNLIAEQSGLFMHYTINQKDVIGIKALSSMCTTPNLGQRLVDKGLIELLKTELNSANGEYWEQCTGIIGNLSNLENIRKLIVDKNLLRTILRRPCLENDGLEVSKMLANMSRDSGLCVDIAHNGLRILLTSLQSKKNKKAVNYASRALYNLSLEGFSKVIVCQNGGIVPLIKTIKSINDDQDKTAVNTDDMNTRRYAIGSLAEISEALELSTTLIEADIVSVLLNAAKTDKAVRRDVARCFAQMSQITEVHGSLAKNGAAEWLASIISKSSNFTENSTELIQYAMVSVCNLAYSPGITRDVLIKSGILHTLSGISISNLGAPLIGHAAKVALSNLRGKEKPNMISSDGIPKTRQPL